MIDLHSSLSRIFVTFAPALPECLNGLQGSQNVRNIARHVVAQLFAKVLGLLEVMVVALPCLAHPPRPLAHDVCVHQVDMQLQDKALNIIFSAVTYQGSVCILVQKWYSFPYGGSQHEPELHPSAGEFPR